MDISTKNTSVPGRKAARLGRTWPLTTVFFFGRSLPCAKTGHATGNFTWMYMITQDYKERLLYLGNLIVRCMGYIE